MVSSVVDKRDKDLPVVSPLNGLARDVWHLGRGGAQTRQLGVDARTKRLTHRSRTPPMERYVTMSLEGLTGAMKRGGAAKGEEGGRERGGGWRPVGQKILKVFGHPSCLAISATPTNCLLVRRPC